MQAYTNTQVRATILVVITLIITLFSVGNTLAQDTNKAESKVYCLPAVLEAVTRAFPGFNASGGQVTLNQEQRQYFNLYTSKKTPMWLQTMHKLKVLDGTAGSGVEVTKWLATKNFPIDVSSSPKAAAGVFDLMLDWAIPGRASSFNVGEQKFASAKMDIANLEGVFASGEHDKPIFKMKPTSAEWEIFVTEFDGNINQDKDLLGHSNRILADLKLSQLAGGFSAVSIPKVDFEKSVDVSFLRGMESKDFRVDQAIKIARLKFSEVGMRASSAVVIRTRGMSQSPYQIKSKFLVIARLKSDQSSFPAFVALCDKDSWVKNK